MSLLKSLSKPNVREVPVDLTVEGEKVSVTVRYKSISIKDVRAQRELSRQREAIGEILYLSETLSQRVTELVEANGNVIKVDAELLESMSINNLNAIQKAIDEATDPK